MFLYQQANYHYETAGINSKGTYCPAPLHSPTGSLVDIVSNPNKAHWHLALKTNFPEKMLAYFESSWFSNDLIWHWN